MHTQVQNCVARSVWENKNTHFLLIILKSLNISVRRLDDDAHKRTHEDNLHKRTHEDNSHKRFQRDDNSHKRKKDYIMSLLSNNCNHSENIICHRCRERQNVLDSINIQWGGGDNNEEKKESSINNDRPTIPPISGGFPASFEITPLPEETGHFTLDLRESRHFTGELDDNNVLVRRKRKNTSTRQPYVIATEMSYRAVFQKRDGDEEEVLLINMLPQITALFQTLIDHITLNFSPHDTMRVFIDHPSLESAIIIPPIPIGYVTTQMILDKIENVLHSAENIPADESLEINVAIIRGIQGRKRVHILNVERDRGRKRSIIRINNKNDNMCLARSIVVAHAHLQYRLHPKNKKIKRYFKKIADSRRKEQRLQAEDIMAKCNIPNNRPGIVPDDVMKYENILDVSISIISAVGGNSRVYNGSYRKNIENRIFLFHNISNDIQHFDVITRVNALMCKKLYCDSCHKGFDSVTDHSCLSWCSICGRSRCIHRRQVICKQCNRKCRSSQCLQYHKKKKIITKGKDKGKEILSICDKWWACPDCGALINRRKRNIKSHICGENKCNVCFQYFMEEDEHLCYMRSINPGDYKANKFIFL